MDWHASCKTTAPLQARKASTGYSCSKTHAHKMAAQSKTAASEDSSFASPAIKAAKATTLTFLISLKSSPVPAQAFSMAFLNLATGYLALPAAFHLVLKDSILKPS